MSWRKVMSRLSWFVLVTALLGSAAPAFAQCPVVYPFATGCPLPAAGLNAVLASLYAAAADALSVANSKMMTDASNANAVSVRTNLGLGTLATQNANALAVTGGTLAGLTGLSIRDTGAARDLSLVSSSSVALTATQTLTFDVVNGSRTVKLGSNLTIATDPGAVTGAIKSNGVGSFSKASAFDLSNGVTGTDAVVLATAPTISNPAISGGTYTNLPTPINSGDAASKSYVDSVSTGLAPQTAVNYATAAVLPNSPTYSNGASGVGATLTAGSNTTLTVDGSVVTINQRVLVKNQAAPAQNGAYSLTTAGGGVPWVLTRVTDWDTAAEIKASSYFFTSSGTANAATGWFMSSAGTPIVGTDPINFQQFSASQAYTATGGIKLVGSAFSLDTPTGSGVPVLGTGPTITGGSITALTSLGIRDTSAAFDVTLAATSSTALTAGRTLTLDLVNAARTFKLGSNLTVVTDPGGVTGALKSNGSGTFAQAAAADLSNGTTGTAGTAVVLATSPSIASPTFTGTVAGTGVIPNTVLANSSMTIAGHSVALGGSQAITCGDLTNGQTGCSTIVGTMATQAASAVAITGGTVAGLTGLAIRDTSAAFDVTLAATSSTTLTGGRTLTFDLVNAARTLKLGANLTIATDPGGVTGALKSNGTGTFAQAAAADLSNGTTGTAGSAVVLATSPTIASPTFTGTVTGPNVVAPVVDPSANRDVVWNGGKAVKDGGARRVYNIMAPEFGALCDNTTNDSTAIAAAATAAEAAGGGDVFIPATGKNCKITSGVSLGNGVRLIGSGTYGFPGTDKTCAQRAAAGGSWIQSTDTVNPAVTLTGHGSATLWINLCYDQPVPGGSFTPTAFGDAIKIAADQATVSGINIMGATVGINLLYPSANGGGFGVVISDVLVTAFSKCFTENFVNDDVTIRNFQCRPLYYASNALVVAYLEANLIGMDLHYFDNPWIDGFECLFCAVGIKFTDDTVLGNTHSLYNGQLTGIQCNLVVRCMQVAASTTIVDAQIGQLQMQSDTVNSASATLLDLGSNNVNLKISDLSVRAAGGQILNLGGGTGGRMAIPYAQVLGYSQVASGQTGFVINTGAQLVKGIWDFRKTGISPGLTLSGTGANTAGVRSPGISWNVFSSFDQVANKVGTGAFDTLSTDSQADPYTFGSTQGRIVSQPNVTVAHAGDVCTMRLSSFPEITGTFSSATTGFKTFDTGYIDLTSADGVLGRVQINCPATTQVSFGSVTVTSR